MRRGWCNLQISKQLAYLIGLITGKGYIDNESITIDFPCNNEFIDGIAHCPLCGYLATKPNGHDKLKCTNKGCKNSKSPTLDLNLKKTYNQAESFRTSINDKIIPFLKESIFFDYSVLSNSSGTSVNLRVGKDLHSALTKLFSPNKSFTSFTIPEVMWDVDDECKTEYVNGLLDTIGFANAGGWAPRSGTSGYGRMRVYFQIINRNYRLPVAIDNYIRKCFSLPIQTIDWGHPNIRDGNLKDYIAGKKSSMGREHQVKFYPEFFTRFTFRIGSKQALFDELMKHNRNCGFHRTEDWFTGKIKPISKVKATHPFEDNPLIDPKVRVHVDAHWQVNLRMGCRYLKEMQDKAADPELFAITGISQTVADSKQLISSFKQKSNALRDDILKNKQLKPNAKKIAKKKNQLTEHDTYPLLKEWMENYIQKELNKTGVVYITSEQTISNFMQDKTGKFDEHVEKFDNFELMSIRPDLIAFNDSDSDFYFIESKITSLGFKELGQILGYCHVAKPKLAFLITTKDISSALRTALVRTPELKMYNETSSVILGILKGDKVEILDI